MNFQIIMFSVIATICMGIAGYISGRHDGRALERSTQDRAAVAVADAEMRLRTTVSESIANLEVRNVYTTQKLEKEVVEVPVYGECVNSPDAFRVLTDSFVAPEDRQESSEDSVPEAGPTS